MNLLYRGPRAWIVWLNLLVACVALIPTFLDCCLWLLHESHGFPFGELSAFPQVFGPMILGAIGENAYVAYIPALLACALLPLLLSASEISWRVRIVIAIATGAALLVLFVNVGVLHRQFLEGKFNFLFA